MMLGSVPGDTEDLEPVVFVTSGGFEILAVVVEFGLLSTSVGDFGALVVCDVFLELSALLVVVVVGVLVVLTTGSRMRVFEVLVFFTVMVLVVSEWHVVLVAETACVACFDDDVDFAVSAMSATGGTDSLGETTITVDAALKRLELLLLVVLGVRHCGC